jgi:hypothetical protein
MSAGLGLAPTHKRKSTCTHSWPSQGNPQVQRSSKLLSESESTTPYGVSRLGRACHTDMSCQKRCTVQVRWLVCAALTLWLSSYPRSMSAWRPFRLEHLRQGSDFPDDG